MAPTPFNAAEKLTINLLTGAFVWSPALKEMQRLKRIIMWHVVWAGVILGLAALLIGIHAYQRRTVSKLQQEITKHQQFLAASREKYTLYVNTYLRQVYLQKLSQKKYDPKQLIAFVDKVIEPTGQIHSYQINAAGEIQLRITADNLEDAAKVWFYLASNKDTIESMNLKTFSIAEDQQGVNFTLQGTLNVQEIYKLYGFKR